MKFKNYLIAVVGLFTLLGTAMATNVLNSTPAIQGYDVVSYQIDKRPVRGNGHFTVDHDDATYIFSSKENMEAFKANPNRYIPAYGGYCAYGVSVGKKFVGDPEVWRVIDNRLYLNLDTGIQDEWFKDVPGRIKTADSKWTNIKNKSPAEL